MSGFDDLFGGGFGDIFSGPRRAEETLKAADEHLKKQRAKEKPKLNVRRVEGVAYLSAKEVAALLRHVGGDKAYALAVKLEAL